MKPYLADPKKTKELLARHEFLIKKGYGQNFLIDPSVPEGIAAAAGLGPEDTVLEIGPGIGTLTQYLAAAAGRVVAANMWGKVKTVILTAALGFLLLFRAMDVSWLHTYALIAIWLSAAATAVSGAVYLLQNADVFRETAPKH